MRTHVMLPVLLVGLVASGANAGIRSGLVGYYPLDEGTGTVAQDLSGKGHQGTLYGVTWIPQGYQNAGAHFNGATDTRINIGTWNPAEGTGQLTLAAWIRWAGGGGTYQGLIGKRDAWPATTMFQFQVRPENGGTFRLETGSVAIVSPNNTLSPLVQTWVHVAATFDGTTARLYLNGEQVASGAFSFNMAGTGSVMGIGCVTGGGAGFSGNGEVLLGDMDEVGIFSRALSAEEVALIMAGYGGEGASNPRPKDKATDVPLDVILGWDPLATAATRDVYFGKNFDDVNDASSASPGNVTVSRGQADTTFAPAGLEYGVNYFWRVDEVNATPDGMVFQGDVWQFTAEPYAYPIAGVTVKASSQQPAWPATRTIDGSGLTDDQHSSDMNHMWMSTGVPAWIQYTFDKEYKLDKLWVWNANSQMEAYMGFGAKSVMIEYSTDGATWVPLENVPEFARGTGLATYTANTIVDFGGTIAKYVRLTINSSWGNPMAVSLSEVRFFYVPEQARAPEPADGATGVSVATDLVWRPGREVQSHAVYLGTDANAVAAATVPTATQTGRSYTPASLEYGTQYFWRVDEVGATETCAGSLWSFATEEFAVIEGFESYNDEENQGTRIYETWTDGYSDSSSGSVVGNLEPPFAERTIVHSGWQAMPLQYDNTFSPYYSEAKRDFTPAQNWQDKGANALRLYVRGNAGAFIETAGGEMIMSAIGTDIWDTADQFRYAYKNLSGDAEVVVRVVSLGRSDGWAKAGVMIRESVHPGSKHAFICVTPGYGVSFQQRPETGNTMSQVSVDGTVAPRWIKLVRKGNVFTAQQSADGVTWADVVFTAPVNVSMPADVLVGLAVTSHNATTLTAAEFSNLSMTGKVTGEWQTAEIGATQPVGNSVEPIYVRIEDSSGGKATVANADGAITVRPSWQEWTIPYSDLAGVNLSRVKTMVIGVGKRSAPSAAGTGTVYIDDISLGRPLAR